MTKQEPPAGEDVFQTWTNAEREVWDAWSKVEQDVSKSDSTHACNDVLDAMEASASQVATLQSAVVRSAVSSLQTNPLLPQPARVLVDQACRPLLSVSGWQQHLVTAWFGIARHAAISVPPCTGNVPSGSSRKRASAA